MLVFTILCFKKIMKLFLIVTFLFLHCQYPLRNSSLLETDQHFIMYNLNIKDVPTRGSRLKSLITKLNLEQSDESKNNLGVIYAVHSQIELVAKTLQPLFLGKINQVAFLNLTRMYYLLEEYSLIRKFVNELVKIDTNYKKTFNEILLFLQKNNRNDERIIILGELINVRGFEVSAAEELGNYYFQNNNISQAEYYFELILRVNPFHKSSLYSLSHMSLDQGNWSDVKIYAKTLLKLSPEKNQLDIYYAIAKAEYELNNFSEAIKYLNQSPETIRDNIDFLALWRDTLLTSNPDADLTFLVSYVKKLKEMGVMVNENDFLYTLAPSGKNLFKNILYSK